MKKLLIIILLVFSMLTIGFVGGVKTADYYNEARAEAVQLDANRVLYYLEYSRQTHADIADNWSQCLYYRTNPEEQKKWVKIYDYIIQYVKEVGK